jgi:hypothetical protein
VILALVLAHARAQRTAVPTWRAPGLDSVLGWTLGPWHRAGALCPCLLDWRPPELVWPSAQAHGLDDRIDWGFTQGVCPQRSLRAARVYSGCKTIPFSPIQPFHPHLGRIGSGGRARKGDRLEPKMDECRRSTQWFAAVLALSRKMVRRCAGALSQGRNRLACTRAGGSTRGPWVAHWCQGSTRSNKGAKGN